MIKNTRPVALFAFSFALSTSVAFAGVAEKKAINASNEAIKAEVNNTQAACGNAQLETNLDWDAFKSMADNNAEKLKKNNYKTEWVIGHAGERTVAVLQAMARICDEDADYKEELAKLTTISVTPKGDLEDYKSEFSVFETTFNINSGHLMTRSFTDFIDPVKAVFE